MSSEINALQKFFSFLYQNDMTAEDVVAEADTNEDGYLTKGEFKNFIKDANINITNDEVSQIFKSLDTKTNGKISGTRLNNRNALDSNEMDKMQEKLDAYTEIKEALNNAVNEIPAALIYCVSIASVEASVLASLNKNFEVRGDLDDVLHSAIAKTAADGYGQAQFTKILNNLKTQNKVPASYNGDDEFQSLLSAYINTLGAETALESIPSDVDKIIIAYFASAAIFINNPQGSNSAALGGNAAPSDAQSNVPNRGNGYASTPFVWDDEYGLNSLQLAVLADRISNAINIDTETYNKFKSEFDAAIQGFISDTCSGMTFSEIVNHLNDFKNSKYGKAVEVLITLSDFSATNWANLDITNGVTALSRGPVSSTLNDKFYQALVSAFGNEFADTLAKADVDYIAENGIYNTVLRTVYQMIMSGEIENNDTAIVNKMIELIIENHAEFKLGLGVGSPNGQVPDLYKNFQTLTQINNTLAVIRNAAITYLDAVWALGNEKLNTFIKNQFNGMDYKTAINHLVSKDVIESKIDTINAKCEEMLAYVDFAEGDESWCLEVWGTNGTENNTQITDYDFSLLYNNNAAICIHSRCDEGADPLDLLTTRLNMLGDLVVNALVNSGYDATRLNQAKENIVQSWINLINYNVDDLGNVDHPCLEGARDLQTNNRSGVIKYKGFSTNWNTGVVAYMVSFRAFVDAIIGAYYKLGGK